jgi:hypothetical protein
MKYICSPQWGCRELSLVERIRRSLKLKTILTALINMIVLAVLIWTVINVWLI